MLLTFQKIKEMKYWQFLPYFPLKDKNYKLINYNYSLNSIYF